MSEAIEGQGSIITEKETAEATTTVLNDDPAALEDNVNRPNRDLVAAIWAIVCGVALPCIPILVVSGVLLGVIFRYQVVPQVGRPEFIIASHTVGSENLTSHIHDIKHDGGSAAYYVDYSPTSITTIAAWTGRIIPYLSSSIMALVAFFAARHIVVKSRDGTHDDLPTPKQLTILINLLGGSGIKPLRDAAVYRWRNKEAFVAPLPAVFTALSLITLIGLLIPLVDTWFGISVHSATIVQLYNISAGAYHTYGRQLDPSEASYPGCSTGPMIPALHGYNNQNFSWPCNIELPIPHPQNLFLVGGQAAAAVQLGLASNNTMRNYTGPANASSSDTPSPNHPIFFIGDQQSTTAEDFSSRTMGMATQCEIITSKCYDASNGSAFSCPGGFKGDFTMCEPNAWPEGGSMSGSGSCQTGIGFAADPQLSRSAGNIDMMGISGSSVGEIADLLQQNPMYFGTWATGFPAYGDTNTALTNDTTEVFSNGSTNAMWLLNCSATVYDVNYTWVNGALHSFQAQAADPEWGAFFSAPFAWSYLSLGLNAATMNLQLAAWDSSYSAQNGSDLANLWAREFSYYALSTSLGVFVPQVNMLEQARNNTVTVARVPLIPLYLLLGFKWLYVVVVLCMAIGVYCFTHPAETEVVKAQLSVKGLVTAHFNQPDLLRNNVVQEVQSRLDRAKGGDASDGSPETEKTVAKEVVAEVASPEQGQPPAHKPKIGLVPTREGTWKFALLVNGAWQSVKPIVQDLVLQEAKAGQLGTVGNEYAAWKS
ncbi:hypothetical protein M406DRAFT_73790 [Cryphonectria parasitica EP155]|uniref:Uncharacterized protein n=1 Tax=Cryphonectria parasitica (strain ATCC 38755 / EP155) TaxID=660469 RepID=A0A9P5CMR7_CRYP1|nr:uncharacterized protein M406DRAFT_73790 [Cryphonectria parasitica EP155]KAF3763160.1 hypothetical protein M406DRAFT_73790 [Cryphonectria parasitica EP155]